MTWSQKWDFFFSLWHHVGLRVFHSGAFQDSGLGMLNPYFLNVTIWMSQGTPYSINPNMKIYLSLMSDSSVCSLFSVTFPCPSPLPYHQPCSFVSSLSKRQKASCAPCHQGDNWLEWLLLPPAISFQHLFLSYATCIPTPLQIINPLSIG